MLKLWICPTLVDISTEGREGPFVGLCGHYIKVTGQQHLERELFYIIFINPYLKYIFQSVTIMAGMTVFLVGKLESLLLVLTGLMAGSVPFIVKRILLLNCSFVTCSAGKQLKTLHSTKVKTPDFSIWYKWKLRFSFLNDNHIAYLPSVEQGRISLSGPTSCPVLWH